MSILETVLIFAGIPLVIYGAIAGLSYLGKPLPGEKPAHYELGQRWTAAPVLWSATDEVTSAVHHERAEESHDHHAETSHGHHAAIDAPTAELIGGRASGKF
ncbi:hypothetical protein DFR70_111210 [Nocardia tenerifensis]|uniref:Uncharacterized protein n=1 Tax=Nocardia tenerifensis TaxID=228006 RepID=A0A318JVN7_9NOCA|nr:hypothetical protein [Nocardia tenerifensis]PXX59825.1 hypothetical protein DFR70_111210 [Nocardia tenerifensis]